MEEKPEERLDTSPKNEGIPPEGNPADNNQNTTPENTVSESPEPVEPMAPVAVKLPIVEPKSGKKLWSWVLLALVVIGLLVGGYFYYVSMTKKPTTHVAVQTTSPSPTPKAPTTAQATIDQVTSVLKGTQIKITKTDAISGSDAANDVVYVVPYYQIQDDKYINYPAQSYGTATEGDKDATATDYRSALTFLKNNNFKQVQTGPDIAPGAPVQNSAVYVTDTVVCHIENADYTKQPLKSFLTSVACADVSSYAQVATAIKPFYTAYAASTVVKQHPEYLTNLYVSASPAVSDGTAGYKNASVTMGEVLTIYYQEPGKDWTYWKSTQNTPSCSEFNTAVLQKAFYGKPCFDTTTNKDSTVPTTLTK